MHKNKIEKSSPFESSSIEPTKSVVAQNNSLTKGYQFDKECIFRAVNFIHCCKKLILLTKYYPSFDDSDCIQNFFFSKKQSADHFAPLHSLIDVIFGPLSCFRNLSIAISRYSNVLKLWIRGKSQSSAIQIFIDNLLEAWKVIQHSDSIPIHFNDVFLSVVKNLIKFKTKRKWEIKLTLIVTLFAVNILTFHLIKILFLLVRYVISS